MGSESSARVGGTRQQLSSGPLWHLTLTPNLLTPNLFGEICD